MRLRTACLLLLAGVTTAHASPPELVLGQELLRLEPRRDVLDDGPTSVPWVRTAGFAQLTGGGQTGGDGGAGVAVAVGGINCDVVAATAQGRVRPRAEEGQVLGDVTYSVCPIGVGLTLKFDGRRATGVTPGLDARRSLWNRSYTEVYDRATLALGPYWSEDGDPQHSIFVMALGHGTTTQHDGFDTRTIKQLDLDLTLYRYRHPDGFGLDAVALTGDAMKAGADNKGGVSTTFLPVRLHYETPALYANAQAGWGFTGGSLTASGETKVNDQTTSSWSETIDSAGLPDMTDLVGEVEVGVRRERLQASGRIARSFYPTFDGNIARESRVAASVTYLAGRTRRTTVTLAPFAARTRTWSRDMGSARELSTGASLQVGRELSRQLRIDAIGEGGMSPYARSESTRLPTSALGGQVVVALSGRVTDLQR